VGEFQHQEQKGHPLLHASGGSVPSLELQFQVGSGVQRAVAVCD